MLDGSEAEHELGQLHQNKIVEKFVSTWRCQQQKEEDCKEQLQPDKKVENYPTSWTSRCAVSNLGMDELMALVNDGSTVEADLYGRVLSDDLKIMSKGLYILLNDRVSGGKAKDIMEAVPANEGFVAWRKLKEEYEKDDPSRFNAMLNGLINPKFEEVMQNTGHSFKDVMREWENAVHRCKKQSKQQFPENMMISVIQTHGTAEVKGLLRLNAANIGNSWDRARAVLDSYIAAGTTYSMAGVPVNPSSNDGVAPMDIGGVHGQPYGQRP